MENVLTAWTMNHKEIMHSSRFEDGIWLTSVAEAESIAERVAVTIIVVDFKLLFTQHGMEDIASA